MEAKHFSNQKPEPEIEFNPHVEKIREYMELARERDVMPIFKGAVLCNDNNLVTNYHRMVELFENMQKGEFEYPESMRQRVESVDIYQGHILPASDRIENLLFRLSAGIGVNWTWEQSKSTGYFIGDRYHLNDEGVDDFLREWADNYEALDFFERCGQFLNIENE